MPLPDRIRLLVLACLALGGIASTARSQPTTTVPTQPVRQAETVEDVERSVAADRTYLTRADTDGLTVLHRATHRGDAAVVKRILELGGDPNQPGMRGITPLHSTMAGACEDTMRRSIAPPGERNWPPEKFIEKERQTRGQHDPQRGPMQFTEVTRLLLGRGASANTADRDGLTPLHLAARTLNSEFVSLLISAKADVNAVHKPRGLAEQTPLTYAAQMGDVDTVRTLLDAGADPAKVPAESRGYFVGAAMRSMNVFRLLLDRGLELPPDALKTATRNGRVEAAAEIIKRGKARDLDAALYAAVNNKREEQGIEDENRLVRTVQTLLDAGASPSAPGGSGEALVAGVTRGRDGAVKLLIDRGAKVDWSRLTDKQHRPDFLAYAAAIEGRLDRLRQFESLGMPLDVMGASLLGRTDRLRALIAADKAQIGESWGANALYFAASKGHVDCVRVLLDAKVDPNERIPSWDTPDIGPRPLEGAAVGGHIDVVRLLLDRRADPALVELNESEWQKVSADIRDLLRPQKRP